MAEAPPNINSTKEAIEWLKTNNQPTEINNLSQLVRGAWTCRFLLKRTQFAKANCATIPSQAVEDQRSGANLGPPHQARYGLIFPQPARVQDSPHNATQRRQSEAAARPRACNSSNDSRQREIEPCLMIKNANHASVLESDKSMWSDKAVENCFCIQAIRLFGDEELLL
jgi:hypothetical protein